MNVEWGKVRTVSQKSESVGGNGVETGKGYKGTFWDDGKRLYLDTGLGYMSVCVSQNSANISLIFSYFVICRFYIKTKKESTNIKL